MKDWKVRYRFESVKQNKVLLHDGYSCVMFNNQGDTDAVINNNVLIRSGESVSFNEDPIVRIDTDFSVKFIDDICAAAKGYEYLADVYLRAEAKNEG